MLVNGPCCRLRVFSLMVVAAVLVGVNRPTPYSKSIYSDHELHGLWGILPTDVEGGRCIGFPFTAIVLDKTGEVARWSGEALTVDGAFNGLVLGISLLCTEYLIRRRRRRPQQAQ